MERMVKQTRLGRSQWTGTLADTRRLEALLRRADMWQIIGGDSRNAQSGDEVSSVQWLTYVVSVPANKGWRWPFPSLVRVKLCFDFRDGTGRVEGHLQGMQKLCAYLPELDTILMRNGTNG